MDIFDGSLNFKLNNSSMKTFLNTKKLYCCYLNQKINPVFGLDEIFRCYNKNKIKN